MTIHEWLRDATTALQTNGNTSARLDALLLLEFVLGTLRATLLSHPETELPATTLSRLNKALAKRLSGTPIAYIVGKKEFYGRDFIVNEHVLIPRPETESMIELVKGLQLPSPHIADIGTGSGCVAITLTLEIPDSQVTAIDIDDDSLAVARQNAKELGARLTFKPSDLLQALPPRSYDVICANLPYVPDHMVTSTEITKEPAIALFSGDDGLDLYRRFFVELAELTNQPMYVVTESLESQHETIEQFAHAIGYMLAKTDVLAQLFVKK
jgi:release factor glutamine methyltransferase